MRRILEHHVRRRINLTMHSFVLLVGVTYYCYRNDLEEFDGTATERYSINN